MTQQVRVTVDVHCVEKVEDSASYRLFVDQELVAERNFVWDHNSKYIREQMTLNLAPGEHPVRIEEIAGRFSAKNLIVNNVPVQEMYINVVNNAS
jgi:hypothetical protein